MTTDGPFVEAREHLGGFYIIEALDLDAALEWASKTVVAIGAPIEVRPFWDEPGAWGRARRKAGTAGARVSMPCRSDGFSVRRRAGRWPP